MDDFDLIEINEAFAAQVIADARGVEQAGQHWDWIRSTSTAARSRSAIPSGAAARAC